MRHAERARIAGERSKAHTFYARAVELKQNDVQAWMGLARCAPTLDEAILAWANALALAPGNIEAQSELDTVVHQRLTQAQASDVSVLVALGRTLTQLGQKSWARRLLQRATELDAHNVEAWLWRAGVTTDNDEAIFCLKQVLAQHPNHPQALAGLKWIESRATTAAVSADTAKEAASFMEQGQHALRIGNLERAYDFFRLATELNPQNESAWYWRGSTAPNLEEAITCIERVLAINPHNQTAKDTLWLLRIKKIREDVQQRKTATTMPSAETSDPASTSASVAVPPSPHTSRPRRRYAFVLSILVSILIIVAGIGVTIWIWMNFFAGK
ncbi:MAG: tetratricopeptide repeat protein [Anaerolineae bacterium]|nr:tetratricopeptide repeat protein [Anaerolineae bacterium]